MNTTRLFGGTLLVGAVFLIGCGPTGRYGYPYSRGYDPYYSGGGYYDPYGGARDPFSDLLYGRSRGETYGDLNRAHEHQHDTLERKYDKAMRRLDRQEREAEEKVYRKSGGNTNDPQFREKMQNIDEKYDHKREKVDRNLDKEHRRGHRRLEDARDDYYGGW